MRAFRKRYLEGREAEKLRIVDIGSMNINGSYQPIFDVPDWRYVGVDMAVGDNVDVILKNPYRWREFASRSVDVLVSGQAFEHIEYFWVTMLEVARVLKPGGLACIIAPSSGFEHRYPVDCWRFYPDGFSAVSRFAGLEVLESVTQWEDAAYADDSNTWHDTLLVGRKPMLTGIKRWGSDVRRFIRHKAMSLGL